MSRHESGSDEDLARLAAGGDPSSLEALIARFRDRLWRLFLRLARGPQEAEDLLQETFVRLLRSHRSFAGHGKFSTWLYAIALNVFRTSLRRRREQGLVEEPPAAAAGPAGRAEQEETVERVRRAVSNLPEPQRTAIVLSRYEGLPYEEIARIEGCSVDVVKQRVRRGLMTLREELKDLQ
jgi:RNA polymerase sigma-70 factor (ECF subfamily)